MMKGFKIRLFPTEEQAVKLWQAIGTSRWVWNWGIAYDRATGKPTTLVVG